MPVIPPSWLRAAGGALVVAALAACAPERPTPDGALDVAVALRAENGDPGLASAWVRARGATAEGVSIDRWIEASGAPGSLAAALRLPAGVYELSARGFAVAPTAPSDAAADFESPARPTVAVTPGAAGVALLVLDRDRGPLAPGNHAPRLEGLVASARTLDSSDPSAALDLAALAADPDDGDVAAVSWTASFDPPIAAAGAARAALVAATTSSSGTTTFAAPPGYAGIATLTATATDSRKATSAASVAIAVRPEKAVPGASVAVTAVLNVFPEIRSISASPGAQLLPGGTTTFTVAAVDANGDALAYAWTDGGCGGTFAAPAAATTAWTAPGAAAPLSCTIQVVVRDLGAPGAPAQPKGGTNTAFAVVSVRPGGAGFGPEFVFATQSPVSALRPGERAWFEVAAVEGGAPLAATAYAWSDGAGGTFSPVVAGDPRYVSWTAPACGAATAPRDLTVTATATGTWGSTTFPFPVRVSCP